MMLLNALRSTYVAIGSFVSASLISIVGGGVATSKFHDAFTVFAILALVVGLFGAAGLVWACVNLLGATRLALMNMTDEAMGIAQRESARGKTLPPG
jgi:hypothetical protein